MRRFDLIIVGTGSGNSILDERFDGWDVAIVEPGTFGGTCLNRGCIPTKMYAHPADLVEAARHAHRLGVDASVQEVRWAAIRDRVFGRIDPIAEGGERYRREADNVTVVPHAARFVAPGVLEAGGERLTADRIVLAAGARPQLPELPGLAGVPFHTSDTVLRLEALPRRLVVLGGGYIATELAHVFEAFGSEVTIITRRHGLLLDEDPDVSAAVSAAYGARLELLCDTDVLSVAPHPPGGPGGVALEVVRDGKLSTVEGDALLVATGRIPNSDELEVGVGGIDCDAGGYVRTDGALATSASGVWALGDLRNPQQLKHLANQDARVVAHNLLHPHAPRRIRQHVVPHAIFGSPQVGAVGLTEPEARRLVGEPLVATRRYADTAYGWAMEDEVGFCKVIAHPRTRLLLGAHVVGAFASSLVQPLVQAMALGQTVDQLAHDVIYPHPALSEVLEQALLELRAAEPAASVAASAPWRSSSTW